MVEGENPPRRRAPHGGHRDPIPRFRVYGAMLLVTLLAASCGGTSPGTAAGSAATPPAETADGAPAGDGTTTTTGGPGAGVEVRMARANWDTGYLQAAILRALLTELDYTVTDPAAAELTPADFYPALAGGDYDFWANGWFPNHDELIFSENLEMGLPEGTVVADYVSRIGTQMPQGALQGFLVDKATADEFGVVSLADIAADPAAWDSDGDGLAEIAGCDDGWGCQATIDNIITINGWTEAIEQVSGDYDVLWSRQIDRLERGEAVLAYTWTPSAYITELVPGRNAYWLAVPRTVFGEQSAAAIPENQCPHQPCTMGFTPADIAVVANNDFLAANPAAAALFEGFRIDVLDVALQNVRLRGGEDSEEDIAAHAAAWIIDNRDTVDRWLAAARTAAG